MFGLPAYRAMKGYVMDNLAGWVHPHNSPMDKASETGQCR